MPRAGYAASPSPSSTTSSFVAAISWRAPTRSAAAPRPRRSRPVTSRSVRAGAERRRGVGANPPLRTAACWRTIELVMGEPAAKESAPQTARVLLVDDEPGVARSLSRLLGMEGHAVTTASDGLEAIALIQSAAFDVIVSDIGMPNMDGLTLLRAIRARDLDVPVVFMTGSPTVETAVAAMEHGAFRYLLKPVDGRELADVVDRAARLHRLGLGRSVYAHEALLRTDEPTLRSPLDFVEAAERLGRTAELGRAVRRRISEQLAHGPKEAVVFVNLHPSDLVDEELSSGNGALAPFAARVALEVTERAALERVHGLGAGVARLRELGFRIALDDLGAGYAGLSSFALLEPEVVKVDMSLVRGIHGSPMKQKLFRSFATLCRDMGTEIIAEGVEVAEERDCLSGLGGDLYQGYLFARPGRGFPSPAY